MKNLLILLAALFCLTNCKKEDKPWPHSTVNQENVQGYWLHKLPKMAGVGRGPDEYEFWFTQDSFKMRRYSWTDYLYQPPCSMSWFTYAKGTFGIENDKINFNGIFTDENYVKLDTAQCDYLKTGAYQMQADCYFIKDTLVMVPFAGNSYQYQDVKLRKQ